MKIGLENLNVTRGGELAPSIEGQFNTEIEYNIACEQLDVCLKAGDELTRLVDNVYSLQAVADKFQSREALSVIHDLTDGKLVEYSAEGFFATAWEKIKAFFKWLWQKISGFFKWVWEKIKALFGVKKKIKATSKLKKIAEKNPKVASLIEETREAQRNNSIIAHFHSSGEAVETVAWGKDSKGMSTPDIGETASRMGLNFNQLIALMEAMEHNGMVKKVQIRVMRIHPFMQNLKALGGSATVLGMDVQKFGTDFELLIKGKLDEKEMDRHMKLIKFEVEQANVSADRIEKELFGTGANEYNMVSFASYSELLQLAKGYNEALPVLQQANKQLEKAFAAINGAIREGEKQISSARDHVEKRFTQWFVGVWNRIKAYASAIARRSATLEKYAALSIRNLCSAAPELINANQFAH